VIDYRKLYTLVFETIMKTQTSLKIDVYDVECRM
jgi:hypothetical protein